MLQCHCSSLFPFLCYQLGVLSPWFIVLIIMYNIDVCTTAPIQLLLIMSQCSAIQLSLIWFRSLGVQSSYLPPKQGKPGARAHVMLNFTLFQATSFLLSQGSSVRYRRREIWCVQ